MVFHSKMKPPMWDSNIAVYWMLTSFMTLEAREQLQYFEYTPLHIGDKNYNKPTKNILMALISILCWYSFESDYNGDLPEDIFMKNKWFHDLLTKNTDETIYSYESFMGSSYWSDLRKGAKELLELTGLGFYPDIPKPIECQR